MKRIVALLLILVFSVMFVVGCNGSTNNTETTEESISDYYAPSEETDFFKIESVYKDLYYPTKFKDDVVVTTSDDGKIVSFTAKIDGKDIKVFDVMFDTNQGSEVARIDKDGKEIIVTVESYVSEDELSDENKALIHEMIEDVNYLIDKIKE